MKEIKEYKSKIFSQIDGEYPEYKPKVIKLKGVSFEQKDLLVSVVPWVNGEGFDISISDAVKGEKMFSLHSDELELIVRGLEYFNFM